jgi:gliding motility-associated-like protein
MTVTVVDPELPVITCAADITQTADAGVCEAAVTVPAPIVTDNCAIASVVNDYSSGGSDASAVYPVGTTVVTYTVTDLYGNTAACSTTVIVTDNEAPVVACAADIASNNDAGVCQAMVNVPNPVATDNCGVASITNDYNNSANATDVYPVGTTAVCFTITDVNGNVSNCCMNVVVTDNELPVVTCPTDITVNNNASSCDATVTVPAITATDNCAIATIVNDYNNTADASDTYPVGTTNVCWTVTDVHGNVSTCCMTVTVVDPELPVITCAANITQTADAGVCEAAVTVPAPIVTDNCAIASVVNDYTSGGSDASGVYPVGTTVVNYTVTDLYGNTATCATSVTVTDNEAPVVTCAADIAATNTSGVCEAMVTVPNPVASDNCGVASITNDYNNSTDATDVYPVGTTAVCFTITDVNGNVSNCCMNVVVTDNELPVVTCPTDITVNNNASSCDATVTVPAITATDNCAIATIVNDYNNTADASDTYPVGTTNVCWTVTDVHGNVSTCCMTVTVVDNELPVVVCPADITVLNNANSCDATVSVPAPSAADNCGIASIVNDFNNTADASDVYPVGSTNVCWTITDVHGNISTCCMVISVVDPELPTITCPADVVSFVNNDWCDAIVTVDAPIVADNCQIATVINDYNGTADATDIYPADTTLVTWTVTDIFGNVASCAMQVVVIDNIMPTISCPADVTANNNAGICGAMVTVAAPVANDNCDIASVINDFNNTADASGMYPVGTTTVCWTTTDVNGNVATCCMNVTVTDNEQPVITCPANITVSAGDGECGTYVTVPAISATDNCAIAIITNDYTSSIDASAVYPVGTTNVMWIVTDIHGNVSTCIMQITVQDQEVPLVICPTDIVISNTQGACEASVVVPLPAISDNCEVVSITNDYNNSGNASDTYPVGTTTVEWTVTDASGNSSSCTMNVTVEDNEAPLINCPANITVNNTPGGCDIFVNIAPPTFSDNCSVASVINSYNFTGNASGIYTLGTTTIVWTATDGNGNSTTCSMTVTVVDTEDPIAPNCGYTISSDNDPGQCGAIINYDIPTVTDNCLIADTTLVAGLPSGSLFPVGTTEVIYLFSDMFGNTTSCNFYVTITDNEVPAVMCTEDIYLNNDATICGAMVNYTVPSYVDNCGQSSGEAVLISGPEPGAIFPVGSTIVTYQITDSFDNVSMCTFTVNVTDNEAPEIICVDDLIQTDPTPEDYMEVVNYELPEVIDNCGAELTILDGFNTGEMFPHGYTNVTWMATDLSGLADTCSFSVLVNNPPTAVDDVVFFGEDDENLNINVIGNDFDVDGDSITITSISGGHGQVTLLADGTITYNINTEEWCGQDTITYTLCDQYNACDTGYLLIDVECFLFVIIPEGISPNGDGVNDVFEIIGIEDYPNNRLAIFNRWGHKVFEAQNYDNSWDGKSESPVTIGGGVLPKGTYYYILDLKDGNKPIKGYFFINR